MEALIELCDLISKNPVQLSDKLGWICSRCPPPASLSSGSPSVSRSQLNALLAITRFLSKCPNYADLRPKSVVVEFLQAIPASFKQSFWPQSFGVESISSFYPDFFCYIEKAMEPPSNLADEVAGFFGEIVISALIYDDGAGISRVFLNAVSQNFPPANFSDVAGRLVTLLLESFSFVEPISPRAVLRLTSETSSAQSSPYEANNFLHRHDSTSSVTEVALSHSPAARATEEVGTPLSRVNGSSSAWRSSVEIMEGLVLGT